ncbi:MAG: peptidoglycan DD-metalloendopeptidase family protein [Gammaproteobacteria bacterium]|nr:peptidoglycan DD-metalloendopeptidase family protein [Gammaproteobacteria bacterium]
MTVAGHPLFSAFSLSKPARLIACSSVLVLAACAGGYQAPVDDRSASLERTAPLIIVDGQAQPASSRAQTASSDTVSATSGAPVGAATTVVRPVTVGTGISRSITRNQMPASEPVTPASAVSQPVTSATSGTSSSQPVSNNAPPAVSAAPSVAQQTTATSNTAPTGTVYVVSQGDTLYSIAFAHNVDVRSLALANNLAAPYTIFPGQRLNLSASGVSAAAISAVPQIPAAPAGEAAPATGQRPQAAIDARRTGSVAIREVDGVSWQWPADGRLLSTFSEASAARGIDIAGSRGQPVFAAADGDVVYAGSGIQGAGNLLILRHNERHLSAYMHNSTMLVAEGDRVRAGDKIAEIGTGPNGRDLLHFEVRVDGKPVDPVRYLPNR